MMLQEVIKYLYSASQRIGLSSEEQYAILQAAATLDYLRRFANTYADKKVKD